MKLFNLISAVVFGLLTILLVIAGFYNPVHFILAYLSGSLCHMAVIDDSYGKSLLDSYNELSSSSRHEATTL